MCLCLYVKYVKKAVARCEAVSGQIIHVCYTNHYNKYMYDCSVDDTTQYFSLNLYKS